MHCDGSEGLAGGAEVDFPFGVFHERRIGGALIDCMGEFCEVAKSKRVFLIGMCILIRARLKFGGCALWRPVAPVNV